MWRPVAAFSAMEPPFRALWIDSSPVVYQGTPSIVVRVLEQNHSNPSVPSIG